MHPPTQIHGLGDELRTLQHEQQDPRPSGGSEAYHRYLRKRATRKDHGRPPAAPLTVSGSRHSLPLSSAPLSFSRTSLSTLPELRRWSRAAHCAL